MSINEMSRTSRIYDHNLHPSTDHLYEPLRNALRKSSANHHRSPPATQQLNQSRITKAARSLSPVEAEMIVGFHTLRKKES